MLVEKGRTLPLDKFQVPSHLSFRYIEMSFILNLFVGWQPFQGTCVLSSFENLRCNIKWFQKCVQCKIAAKAGSSTVKWGYGGKKNQNSSSWSNKWERKITISVVDNYCKN